MDCTIVDDKFPNEYQYQCKTKMHRSYACKYSSVNEILKCEELFTPKQVRHLFGA